MSWQRPYSELRASDSERERVVEFLREHALVGRLNHDELEERIGLAYSAVTRGDLERLIGDLPRRNQPVPRRPRPTHAVAVEKSHEPKPFMVLVGLASLAIPMAVLAGVAVALFVVIAMSGVVMPLLIVALVVAALRRRRPHGPGRGGMAGGYG
jgi:hypothetical protein